MISGKVWEPVGDLAVQEDPFVTQALYLMPNVMATTSRLNHTQMPTWQNLDGFVESLLRDAYHTSWNSMHTLFSNESPECNLMLPMDMLEVSISRSRVAYWLGINFLLTISDPVLLAIEWRCSRLVVLDFAVAAMTMDASAALQKSKSKLTRMSYIIGEDASVGKIRLVKADDGFSLVPLDPNPS